MALRLEAVRGVKADLWLRLQAAYDLAQARQNKANLVKGLRRLTVPVPPAGLPAAMPDHATDLKGSSQKTENKAR